MTVSNEEAIHLVKEYLQALSEEKKDTFAGRIPLQVTDCCSEEQTMCFMAEIIPELKNFWGVAHGGMLATIFDTCMGYTIRAFRMLPMVRTVTLNISYLRAVPLRTDLHIRVRLLTAGKTLATLELTAWIPGEEALPTNLATGTFYLR